MPHTALQKIVSIGQQTPGQATPLALWRLCQAAHGDSGRNLPDETGKALQEIQRNFKEKLDSLPYRQLVEDGHLSQLLDDYLGLMAIASEKMLDYLELVGDYAAGRREEEKLRRYAEERDYYYHNPQVIQEIGLRFKGLIVKP
ncbi:MAG: hypothetical protein KGJ06_03395 [Pseudomonadota bacterium]|nr:hypothetical protein [Pseudomonadota bacterium]